MRVIIDADACPVVRIAERISRDYSVECTLVCDTAHVMKSDYSNVITVDKGADSADYKIVNMLSKGDVIVTQDYGLAAMCISRGAHAINQNGMIYSNDNIDGLLFFRAASTKARRAGKHLKGPKKRTAEQDIAFEKAFIELIKTIREL